MLSFFKSCIKCCDNKVENYPYPFIDVVIDEDIFDKPFILDITQSKIFIRRIEKKNNI